MTENLVRRYQEAHLKKFGQSITAEEAERELLNLIDLVKAMASIGKA